MHGGWTRTYTLKFFRFIFVIFFMIIKTRAARRSNKPRHHISEAAVDYQLNRTRDAKQHITTGTTSLREAQSATLMG